MNILLVSHCDFNGNSAMHVFNVAQSLQQLGVDPIVAVPNDTKTVWDYRAPTFPILHHDEVTRFGTLFSNGRAPDLIHAWTPRDAVHRVVQNAVDRYGCPYLVHLEDNEQAVLEDEVGRTNYQRLAAWHPDFVREIVGTHRTHPKRAASFLAAARGVTVLMDRLLEFKPDDIPGLVFWPGFEPEFLKPTQSASAIREELGVSDDEVLIVYNGNIHHSNEWEVSSLILAVRLLKRKGRKVKLVKTGWNYAGRDLVNQAKDEGYMDDLGFVPRNTVPSLVAAADILVQPGRPNVFNDYRFPSKLPEFLASGKPVILPHSNIGRFLQDGVDCLLLNVGDALEVADKIEQLIQDPELRTQLGRRGQTFANDNLIWSKNVQPLYDFYSKILAASNNGVQAICHPPAEEKRARLPVQLIAFYLPQFHPIKENDEWWGKGFTEWSNVTRATPMFPDHHQPQLPSDLGFYDLRVPEVMEQQAALAASYGISGFCYYYYWFNGKKLLDLPLNQLLASGKPDFPFCLCWANENWTRAWDGAQTEILMEQVYGREKEEQFIHELIPIFRDARYIRINEAPLLLVYRPNLLPDAAATAALWRSICKREGIGEIHLAMVQSFGSTDPRPFGFDSAVEFPPHVTRHLIPPELFPGVNPEFEGYLEDYVRLARHQVQQPAVDYVLYRGIMPAWDNSARRGKRAHIVVRSTPDVYEKWLRVLVDQTMAESGRKAPLLFVNAWNEWAEGAHLEPDQKYGKGYLEATRRGFASGVVRHLNRRRLSLSESRMINFISEQTTDGIGGQELVAPTGKKTASWFDNHRLEAIYDRYGKKPSLDPVSYATVADFCESFDNLGPLATANGDLKDVQRPWLLKAIVGLVPRGGRVLEIGAGEPWVADILSRLGYEVWIVDPYDGSGNGPSEYSLFSAQCPDVRFIRDQFSDRLLQLPVDYLDCIYSISVLEHVPPDGLRAVAAGIKKFLKPDGINLHAVDHVHRGNGADEHLTNLRLMIDLFGFQQSDLDRSLNKADTDSETYFLSAESHNRWRGSTPYNQFPMRTCLSVQMYGGRP